jgi:hypothetical protein
VNPHQRLPGLTHLLPALRVTQQRQSTEYGFGHGGRSHGGVRIQSELSCFREVEHVRADDDRFTDGARFEQILPAILEKAAPDDNDIASALISEHLPHTVTQPNLRGGPHCLVIAAALSREALSFDERGHLIEALRMARNEQQQSIAASGALPGLQ